MALRRPLSSSAPFAPAFTFRMRPALAFAPFVLSSPSSAPRRSFWKIPGDERGIDTEYEHGKRKTLEETLWQDAGLTRWGFGEIKQGFGTFEKPVVVVSAAPERIIGCVGDGGAFEHPLMFFNAKKDGPKYMCSACGQFFIVRDIDPSVDKHDLETVEKISHAVKEADHGKIPPNPHDPSSSSSSSSGGGAGHH